MSPPAVSISLLQSTIYFQQSLITVCFANMSSQPQVAPYGTWSSPISVDLVSGSSVSFFELHVNVSQLAIPELVEITFG